MFSAYTIRKILPRLLIAAVAIQISWWLTIAAISITNDIAHGIQGLMYAPFGGSGAMGIKNIISMNSNINAAGFSASTIFVGAAAGVAWIAAGASSLVGILALATTAALGILIALFTLVLRQAVIISLVVVAPLAIAASVLPGTQKLWKIWWESFSKLLLMYPLILIIIAGGRIFAYVAANTKNNQFVTFILIILGCFGPLFLIPATLKLSGAAFGALTGAINNRGKGAFDRLRNIRGNEAKKNWANTRSGQRFKGSNAATARLNRIGAGVAAGPSGRFGLGKSGKNYMDEFLMTNSDELMKTQAWKGNMFKDDAMRALTYGNEAAAKAALEAKGWDKDRIDGALIAAKRIGYGRTSQVAAARQMAMNKTGFEDAADAMETVNRVSGADAATGVGGNQTLKTSLKENVKFINKGVGRHDGGALGDMNEEEQRLMGQGAAGQAEARKRWNTRLSLAGAQTADGGTLARDHSKSNENVVASAKDVLEHPELHDDATVANAKRLAKGLGGSTAWATLANMDDAESLGKIESDQKTEVPTGEQVIRGKIDADSGTVDLRSEPVKKERNLSYGETLNRGSVDPNDPNLSPPDAGGMPGPGDEH